MNLRSTFYKHPFSTVITAVFFYSLLITVLYVFDVIPGVQTTHQGLTDLLIITGILFAATAASWMTAMILGVDDM